MRITERHSFEALGQKMKSQREAAGLRLSDLAEKTRIPQVILEGIESGNPIGLPAPVFVLGFLRSYAREVGMSPDEVIKEYKAQNPELEQSATAPITVRREANARSGKKTAAVFLVILILIGGLGAIYYYSPNINFLALLGRKPQPVAPSAAISQAGAPDQELVASSEDAPPPDAVPQMETDQTPAPPADSKSSDVKPEGTQIQTAQAPEKTAPASKGHELRIDFTKESWIQVMVDDKEIQHGLYEAGSSKTWKATDKFKIRIGNAGGVRVFLDGKELEPLGPDGKAISLTLPKPVS